MWYEKSGDYTMVLPIYICIEPWDGQLQRMNAREAFPQRTLPLEKFKEYLILWDDGYRNYSWAIPYQELKERKINVMNGGWVPNAGSSKHFDYSQRTEIVDLSEPRTHTLSKVPLLQTIPSWQGWIIHMDGSTRRGLGIAGSAIVVGSILDGLRYDVSYACESYGSESGEYLGILAAIFLALRIAPPGMSILFGIDSKNALDRNLQDEQGTLPESYEGRLLIPAILVIRKLLCWLAQSRRVVLVKIAGRGINRAHNTAWQIQRNRTDRHPDQWREEDDVWPAECPPEVYKVFKIICTNKKNQSQHLPLELPPEVRNALERITT